jgi:hypothetical protein
MSALPRMRGCVTVWRIITTQRGSALLTTSQMYPLGADLDAFLALSAFCVLDTCNRFQMGTGNFGHHRFPFMGTAGIKSP